MTYAILKEGVLHLFEGSNKPEFGFPISDLDLMTLQWNNKMAGWARAAIVAEDQDMVKKILGDKAIEYGSDSYIGTYESRFYPLPGYRIEVKEVIVPSYVDKYGDLRHNDFIKTAKLIKE